jgi:hypothetical protein
MLQDLDPAVEHDDQVVGIVTVREQYISDVDRDFCPVTAEGAQLSGAKERALIWRVREECSPYARSATNVLPVAPSSI